MRQIESCERIASRRDVQNTDRAVMGQRQCRRGPFLVATGLQDRDTHWWGRSRIGLAIVNECVYDV